MKKKSKNVITTILLMMALVQGPYFYYFTTGFFKMIVLVPFSLIGLSLTIFLLIKLIRNKSTNNLYHIIGITTAFFIGLLTIRTDFIEYFDFKFRLNERNKIVEDIKRGILKPNSQNNTGICNLAINTLLPISNGGNDILINENKDGLISVEFYIDRGAIDHYSAFLYTNDKQEIINLDRDIANGNDRTIKKFADNWYRVGY